MATERKQPASKRPAKDAPDVDRKNGQQAPEEEVETKSIPYRGSDQLKPGKRSYTGF